MKSRRGFSLIEVMIVVTIIGILAAIAWPSFQSSLRKGNRAAAQAHLMDVSQRQQQFLLDNRAYAADLAALNMATPAEVARFYTIVIAAAAGPPPAFSATANPKAGTYQAVDPILSINQAGAKTPADKW